MRNRNFVNLNLFTSIIKRRESIIATEVSGTEIPRGSILTSNLGTIVATNHTKSRNEKCHVDELKDKLCVVPCPCEYNIFSMDSSVKKPVRISSRSLSIVSTKRV